ncbi:MAG: 50S ribosomal protein L13 [Patescibacteria group bacterium]
MTYIDATNQVLGRLATRIAVLLRGKTKATYQPNLIPAEKITVTNVSKLKLSTKKLDQKTYFHYSGYPGGMKARTMQTQMERDPRKVLWLAVYRMLAPNRLRAKMMKNLIIEK